MEMDEVERKKLLDGLDFSPDMQKDIDTTLQALPTVDLSAEIFVEGEDETQCGDVATCRVHPSFISASVIVSQVRVVLTRKSHETGSISDADLKGGGFLCFSPYYPFDRPEQWYIMVMLPKENRIVRWTTVVLKDAEIAGLSKKPTEEGEEKGQVIDLQFPALFEGTHDVHIGCYSDCWIGCDKLISTKLTIKKASKSRPAAKPATQDISSDLEEMVSDEGGSEADEDEAAENEEPENDEYDTEETGELETGTDEEEDASDQQATEQTSRS